MAGMTPATQVPVPVVAAGACLGMGLGLMAGSDIAYGATNAKIGT